MFGGDRGYLQAESAIQERLGQGSSKPERLFGRCSSGPTISGKELSVSGDTSPPKLRILQKLETPHGARGRKGR